MKLGIYALSAALSLVLFSSMASAQCATGQLQGVPYGETGDPPSTYVVGVTATSSTTIVVYYRDFDTTTISNRTISLSGASFQVSGSWGSPTGSTKVTTVQFTGGNLRFNNTIALSFTATGSEVAPTFNNTQFTTVDGMTSMDPVIGSAAEGFDFYFYQFGHYNFYRRGITNLCAANVTLSGNTDVIDMKVTTFPGSTFTISSISVYVDGQYLGFDASAPFEFPIYSGQFSNGRHDVYAVVNTSVGYFIQSANNGNPVGFHNSIIGAGYQHTCFVRNAKAFCVGNGGHGRLGFGNTSGKSVAEEVPGLSSVTQVDAGIRHTCAIASSNLYCWGSNSYGQLGDGTRTNRLSPTKITTSGKVTGVGVGGYHTCMIEDGDVKCWGRNAHGAAGQPASSYETSKTTLDFSGLGLGSQVPQTLMGGEWHSCVVAATPGGTAGRPVCWGRNTWGQLGDGTFNDSYEPVLVSTYAGNSYATGISMSGGSAHTCIAGTINYCWGNNGANRLGINSISGGNYNIPQQQSFGGLSDPDIRAVATGAAHSCVLRYDYDRFPNDPMYPGGTMVCAGHDLYGQAGDDTSSYDEVSEDEPDFPQVSTYFAIPDPNGYNIDFNDPDSYNQCMVWTGGSYHNCAGDIVHIDAGYRHTCALNSIGKLYCWGWNTHNQCDHNDTLPSPLHKDTPHLGHSNDVTPTPF